VGIFNKFIGRCLKTSQFLVFSLAVMASFSTHALSPFDWFGEKDPDNMSSFQISMEVLKTFYDDNGDYRGVGSTIDGSYAKVGLRANLEAILFPDDKGRSKVHVFCSPSVGLESNPEITAHIHLIRTFGCEKPEDYTGNFLTLDLGMMGPVYGPIMAGGSVNFSHGIDMLKLVQGLRESGFYYRKFIFEQPQVFSILLRSIGGYIKSGDPIKQMSALVLTSLIDGLTGSNRFGTMVFNQYKNFIFEYEKLANTQSSPTKEILNNAIRSLEGVKDQIPHTLLLLRFLSNSLTGCDAATINLSAGLTTPVPQVKVFLTYYSEYSSFDYQDKSDWFELSQFLLASRTDRLFAAKLAVDIFGRCIKPMATDKWIRYLQTFELVKDNAGTTVDEGVDTVKAIPGTVKGIPRTLNDTLLKFF
jgi:hypothetical protein